MINVKKNIIIIMILSACIFGFGSFVFAQEQVEPTIGGGEKIAPTIDEEDKVTETTDQTDQEYEMLRGRLASIDRKKNQVVIWIDVTGQERIIVAKKELPKNLKIGLHIKAKVKKGTNEADYVKKIHHAGE